MLELENVHVRYGPIEALHGVSLRVARGTIVTLIGGNGAGKSTTLRTISGLLTPTAGRITFEGRPIQGRSPHEILGLGIGHVPEGRQIFPTLTVGENLRLGAFREGRAHEVAERLETVFQEFPVLRERARQLGGTLSGGEQQMLAVARALMGRPKLVLLDEPSLGLAPLVTQELFRTLGDLNREDGLSMLVVEQNAGLALKLAARGYVLETGTIVASGSASDLAGNDDVRRAYLGI